MTCTGSQGFLVNLPAMNRRIIIFVVSMMGFALLGLLSIQVYWIRNSIQMKEAAFTTGVTEAVSGAVMTLDRIQSARRLRNFKESARLYRKVDSLNFLIDKRYQELTGEKPETGKTPKRKNGRAPVDPESRGWRTLVQLDSTLKQGSPTQEQKDTTITDEAPPQKKRKPTPDVEKDSRMQRLNKQRQRILDELMRRSYLYDAALQGFEAESRILPLEKRIDPGLLDSLLGAGLEAKGIRTAFEFGVFDPTRDSLVIEKTGDYSQELLTRGFAINLFPSGSKSNPAYLAVYFPNETRFVLSQIWWMLLVSGLFILVIVVLFYQTVSTIIRQKKLSDMKNDFINNMTHEFKTPISTISLVCEALRDHEVVQSPEMAMNYIGIDRKSVV